MPSHVMLSLPSSSEPEERDELKLIFDLFRHLKATGAIPKLPVPEQVCSWCLKSHEKVRLSEVRPRSDSD